MAYTRVGPKESLRQLGSKSVSPLFLFILWTALGLLFAFAWYLPSGAEGKPIPFKTSATWYLLDSYGWLALSPLIFFLHRRFPVEGTRLYRYRWHLLLALLVSWLHFSIFIGLDRLLDPAFSARFHTVLLPDYQWNPHLRDDIGRSLRARLLHGPANRAGTRNAARLAPGNAFLP
jgi:hypothetical protein